MDGATDTETLMLLAPPASAEGETVGERVPDAVLAPIVRLAVRVVLIGTSLREPTPLAILELVTLPVPIGVPNAVAWADITGVIDRLVLRLAVGGLLGAGVPSLAMTRRSNRHT